jgi:hypothetical protein
LLEIANIIYKGEEMNYKDVYETQGKIGQFCNALKEYADPVDLMTGIVTSMTYEVAVEVYCPKKNSNLVVIALGGKKQVIEARLFLEGVRDIDIVYTLELK